MVVVKKKMYACMYECLSACLDVCSVRMYVQGGYQQVFVFACTQACTDGRMWPGRECVPKVGFIQAHAPNLG